jgi:hypothetical protein
VFKLLGCNQDGIDQLLDLGVPRFGLVKYLADEVNMALDFVDVTRFVTINHDDCGDHTISGHNIEKKDIISLRSNKD